MVDVPSSEDAKKAVEVLLRWVGDDPESRLLANTPQRVVSGLARFFSGYAQDAVELLRKSTAESNTLCYKDMIVFRDIDVQSYCAHHFAPMIGKACVAYVPDKRIVGLGKISDVVNIYSRRLQIQENLTVEIANGIAQGISPLGVAVFITAKHYCSMFAGEDGRVGKIDTCEFVGCFKDSPEMRAEFLNTARTCLV